MKKFLAVLAFMIPSLTFAQSQEWEPIAKTDTSIWEFQKGSLRMLKDQDSVPHWTVMFRVHDTKDASPTIIFWRLAVSFNDCNRREGALLFIKPDRNTDGSQPFVFGGGTLASQFAETICAAGDIAIREANKTPQKPKVKDQGPITQL